MSATMIVAMCAEAWQEHVTNCDHCSWITLQMCADGQRLREAWSEAAVNALVPPPTVQRSVVKA